MLRLVVGLFSLMVEAAGGTILALAYETFAASEAMKASDWGASIFIVLAGLTMLSGGLFGLWREITGRR